MYNFFNTVLCASGFYKLFKYFSNNNCLTASLYSPVSEKVLTNKTVF